ncbi:MAG: hypothetical protein ACRC1H_04050, partial [Caldilineaceae bacterium]
FWLAPRAADSLFFDHLRAADQAADQAADLSAALVNNWEETYSLAWRTSEYDDWAAADPNRTPASYALWMASRELVRLAHWDNSLDAAIARDNGQEPWILAGFRLTPAGPWLPLGD